MKITARYIDTCLSDYLQDSYSRPGQTLCLTSPGCSLEDSVEALFDSIDWDAGVPESTNEIEIKDAFRTALKGVDLRHIDEDGNRQEEESEDEEYNCESYIYVVLEWKPCEHDPIWASAAAADSCDGIIDISCGECGASGSVQIAEGDINW